MRKNRRLVPHLVPYPLVITLAFTLSLPVMAQQGTGALMTSGIGTPAKANAAPPSDSSMEQQSSSQRAWTITPRLGLSLTATDHVNVNAGKGGDDLITEISPGIHIQAQTPRLRGNLDYALRGQFYQNNGSRHQNALNAFTTLEAVDDWFFIDASGHIAQRSISAFGPQSASGTSINGNSAETSTYRLSPYIRGTIGHVVDYSLRYNATKTRSDNSAVSGIDLSQWTGQLRGDTPFHNLRWTLDANRQTVDYSSGRKTDADLNRLLLTYLITPQFSVSASAGWERNDYASLDRESKTTHGYGFDWNPTSRTRISAFKERRFFGDGYRLSLSHRFPRSSIHYSDTRDVSILPSQSGTVGFGSAFDQWYDNFAYLIPLLDPALAAAAKADPALRAFIVNQFLASVGIDPNQEIVSGFISSQASEQRRQQLSYVLLGARNTLTLQFTRSENSRMAAFLLGTGDDFSRGSRVRQQGFGLTLAHKLTPLSNLNLTFGRQKSSGNYTGTNNLDATTTRYQLSLTTPLGAKTHGSLSVRHTKYDGNINPYTENALIANLLYTY